MNHLVYSLFLRNGTFPVYLIAKYESLSFSAKIQIVKMIFFLFQCLTSNNFHGSWHVVDSTCGGSTNGFCFTTVMGPKIIQSLKKIVDETHLMTYLSKNCQQQFPVTIIILISVSDISKAGVMVWRAVAVSPLFWVAPKTFRGLLDWITFSLMVPEQESRVSSEHPNRQAPAKLQKWFRGKVHLGKLGTLGTWIPILTYLFHQRPLHKSDLQQQGLELML